MRETLGKFKTFLERYERPLSVVALCFGFIVDSLTLRRIDFLLENVALIAYLTIVGVAIVVLALRERETSISGHRILAWVTAIAPFAMQFAFGGLFSAFVVFYFRSASLSASWPFILFLFGMLVGNELFRRYYERLVFHVSVFFVALLSYSMLLVPVLIGSLGNIQFLLSVVVSLILIYLFLLIVSFFARERVQEVHHFLIQSISAIAVVYMFSYITNIIPPVPLALKDSAVAHGIVRTTDAYTLSVERHIFMDTFRLSETYHRTPGEPVYVWTSVFAPTELSTAIVHNWQYKEGSSWKTKSNISFPITGGSDRGYRGYSMKENLESGAWRVSVETSRGQVIGRVRFDIVDVSATEPQQLIEK